MFSVFILNTLLMGVTVMANSLCLLVVGGDFSFLFFLLIIRSLEQMIT